MTPRRRSAFSLIEIIIAMVIALMVSGVIFFTFVATTGNTAHGVEFLEFLRRGTLILEYLKQDIRAATKDPQSVTSGEGAVKIHRLKEGKEIDITYTFDAGRHVVVRKGPDGETTFGMTGGEGRIFSFEVKAVEEVPGFYRANVEFVPPPRKRKPGEVAQPSDPKANKPYPFKLLVNKRSSEDSDRDVRWNYAYDGAAAPP